LSARHGTNRQATNWIEVEDVAAAAAALPEQRARVFLGIGRRHLAPFAAKPQHAYTLRLVDTPEAALPLQHAEVIVSRGPFTLAGDLDLMRSRDIEWIVARNAGGSGAFRQDRSRASARPSRRHDRAPRFAPATKHGEHRRRTGLAWS